MSKENKINSILIFAKGHKFKMTANRILFRHEDDPVDKWKIMPGRELCTDKPKNEDTCIVFCDFSGKVKKR